MPRPRHNISLQNVVRSSIENVPFTKVVIIRRLTDSGAPTPLIKFIGMTDTLIIGSQDTHPGLVEAARVEKWLPTVDEEVPMDVRPYLVAAGDLSLRSVMTWESTLLDFITPVSLRSPLKILIERVLAQELDRSASDAAV